MKLEALQSNWDELGKRDPYWAVLSDPRRIGQKWDAEEFYETGRVEIQEVLRAVAELGLPLNPDRALDFGCGTGRLTQALCAHFRKVVGVDIAPSMISLARQNNRHPDRCEYLVNSDDNLRCFADGEFSFLYSRIVLQHIPSEHSQKYIREFLRVIGSGGVLVFQVPAERKDIANEALPEAAYRAKIALRSQSIGMSPGAVVPIAVTVKNASPFPWPSLRSSSERCNINLGNHWRNGARELLVEDDGRLALPRPIGPGESFEGTLSIRTPAKPGRYVLELDLVHEGVTWFAARGSSVMNVPVEVKRSKLAVLVNGLASLFRPRGTACISATPGQVEYPQLGIYPVPKSAVLDIIAKADARLVAVKEDNACGQGWQSYCYYVIKD